MKMQKSGDNTNSYVDLHSKICTALEYHGVDEIRQWKGKIPVTPIFASAGTKRSRIEVRGNRNAGPQRF